MAKSSVKQQGVTQVAIAFDGGLNLADNPDALSDNQLADVVNMFYEEGRTILTTRPGLVHAAGPPPDAAAIVALHWYERDAQTGMLIAATSGGGLYRLDESGDPPDQPAAWVHVTDLNQPGLAPSLATFHGKLIIADGGPHLRAWDGQAITTLAGSPSATAVVEIGGRLAANSAQDMDGVALCGPYDETDWDIDQGGAVFLRAGYGDGLRVTGFGVIGQDLIVFKSGESGKRIMRLQTAGASSSWALTQLSRNLTAHGHRAVEFVGNNLLFAGEGGIMDLAGVQQYGDIQVGGVGRPVNPALNSKHVAEMRFLPRLGVMLAFVEGDSRVLVFHPHNQAWTRLDFQALFLSSACQAGDRIYLGGQNGRLYRLGMGESRDELAPGQYAEIKGLARSKVFTAQGEMVLRKTRLNSEAVTPGTGKLQVFGSDQVSPVTLHAWVANPGLGKLAEATGPVSGAAQPVGVSAETQTTSRTRFRDAAMSFQITTTSGRIRLRLCLAEIAQVRG